MHNDATRGNGEEAVLGPRFLRALEYAAKQHGIQSKKGGDVPYLAHLLGVSALVLEDGGSEREAIAALLHDVVEDAGVSVEAVRKRFGQKVARIVAGCSDVRENERHTAENWRERHARILARLRDPSTRRSVVRVAAADTLHNARSVCADLRRHGPEVWQRFHAGAVDQLWYYRSVSVIVSARIPGYLADELRVAVHELERVAGWWFDVGDPQSN
jgi:(p)ppGpp synthase/HD superfamily hydrolase